MQIRLEEKRSLVESARREEAGSKSSGEELRATATTTTRGQSSVVDTSVCERATTWLAVGTLSWMLGNWRISQKMGARAEKQVSNSLPLARSKKSLALSNASATSCLPRRQLSVTRRHRLTAWIPCLYFNRTCNFPRVGYHAFLGRKERKTWRRSELNWMILSFFTYPSTEWFSINFSQLTIATRFSTGNPFIVKWNFPRECLMNNL